MLRRSDGLITLQHGGAAQEWVLARRFCAFTLLDASAIPLPKRKGFAAMAVQRWSPFADGQHHIEWAGARAMVWAWSAGEIRELGPGNQVPAPRRVVPESLLRGLPVDDGVGLVGLDEGVEGRVWRDRVLVASQWWPSPPGPGEWGAFLRGAGLAAMPAVPEAASFPLADRPWSRHQGGEAINVLASRHRGALQLAAVVASVALLATPLVASLHLLAKTYMLERVIAREVERVGPLLAARESAERDMAAVDAALALRPPARQLQLMSSVVAATPSKDWTLREWRMRDPRTLEVVMQMANPDPTAIVRGWEALGVFGAVSVELGRSNNEVTVKAAIGPDADASARETGA